MKSFSFILIGVLFLFMSGIAITPLIMFTHPELGNALYHPGFSWACHQKLSRSICLFQDQNGYSISDCTAQTGTYITNDQRIVASTKEGVTGYKFPVCTRDIAIYGFLLLGSIYMKFFKPKANVPPAIWFILALIPMGIDGTLQLISNLGISLPIIGAYESTNFMRFLTGGIAGIVASRYVVPVLDHLESRNVKGNVNGK